MSESGRVGLGFFFLERQRAVAADGFEVEEQEEVDQSHGGGDPGVGFEGGAVTGLVGGDDFLLGFGAFFGFFGGGEFGAVEAVGGGGLDVEELRGGGGFVFAIERGVGFFEGFTGEAVLAVTEAGAADQACGEHADTTHDGHGDGAGAREAVADDGEHGGPEEGFADGVDAEGDKGHGEVLHAAGEVQADVGEHSANEEEADGGELQLGFNEVGAEAEGEHDGGGPDEEGLALFGREEVAGDVLDPAVGAEFDRADEGVGDEEDEEEDGAEGELADDSGAEEEETADDHADHFAIAGAFEDVSEEFGEQVAGNEGAEDADGFEHFGEAGAFFGSFGFREFLAHEHDAVEDRWDEVEGELGFPAELHFVVEIPADDGTDDHARRPGGVEDIQVMGAVFGVEGGDEGVGDGFEGAVGVSEDEHAPEQEVVGVVRGAGHEGDDGGEDVADEGEGDEFAVADFVDDEAAEDDAEAEAGEACAANGAELSAGEAVFFGPVVKDASADGEADAGCEDGHETRPEEAASVGCDTFV